MGQDVIKEWFDDLNEANVWLTSLTIYCSKEQKSAVSEAAASISDAISRFMYYGSSEMPKVGQPSIRTKSLTNLVDIVSSAHQKL